MCFRPSGLEINKKCQACGADAKPADVTCPACGASLMSGAQRPATPAAPGSPAAPNAPKAPGAE